MDRFTKDEIHPKIIQKLLEDSDITIDDALENEMVLNMGPQHPATHGVLRLVLKLDGETVIGCVPDVGYLHRGYEKMAENMSYHEFIPHTDRLDYISPTANNVAWVMAVEKLAGVEVPVRAQYIRMIIAELARIASHLVAIGSFAMDVGALTVFLWTFREREKIMDIWDIVCGARFTNSYTRIGGVANDMQPEAIALIKKFLEGIDNNLIECEKLLNTNRIFIERLDGVGVISKEDALSYGYTGPNLRATGVDFDLRRAVPYLQYDKIDFRIPTFTEGDCLARYFVRTDEIRESAKIVRQCLQLMPSGEIKANLPKRVLPNKAEVYTKMEELILDFMLINFGINPPVGEIYHAIEGSKGELGFYLVSDGKGNPWKCKIRSPSFIHIQSLPHLVKGRMISDVVAIIGSIDPIMGEADK
ncbi:MAG: NADH dehydrogenase (quinone) subunit D [Ignavibacteriota bacterium]|jgi:NADH-quinone oxidoreductase subunit D|nr:MAG: NADH dehydrogenase (quinone) subunit D [Ignavibacterium sp.]MBL1154420.1 NADH dehydrogenase (quinone) subunit D [Ignavibacteriota bacterium]MCO6446740.1 NADH dehydrogenase (quinone) subunit D [Ignavibacterium album]MCZ2268144.1 NADH dehydrogenase (quinone) subunit D [Ignavibacteriales bacterium]MDX9712677.1 NADH dehydrogenase (quinone) subunit D [Ignavibacteriaceae bacterium]